MGGELTLGGTVASALRFFGDVLFMWVPSVVTTVSNSIEQGAGTTTPGWGSLTRPISATGFPAFLERVSAPGVYDSLVEGWYVYVLLSFAFSLPFLAVGVYCLIRVFLLRRHERRMLLTAQHPVTARDVPKAQLRWSRILEQSRGGTEHGWRLAILEADIMLSELLDMQGYKGETMADKMKQVDRANFNSIDAAWAAHKVRNRVAHEGIAHALDQREVRRVISLYERVFREFGYIE
jgi:hypothetical protein